MTPPRWVGSETTRWDIARLSRGCDTRLLPGAGQVVRWSAFRRHYFGSGERLTLDARADTARVLALHLDTSLGNATSHLVVLADGGTIASEPPSTVDALSVDAGAVVNSALKQRRPSVSNLLELQDDGARGVLCVAPILVDDAPIGAVVGEMQLPHPAIYGVASALQLGKTGHMEVVDAHGVVLASTRPEDMQQQPPGADT